MQFDPPHDHAGSAATMTACRAALRAGSSTFFSASLLLPASVRLPASALYAFCRTADDDVDGSDDKRSAVGRVQARLDALYAGGAESLADRAFAAVVTQHGIPRALPAALVEGFAWDAEVRRYESLEDLTGYAARVAGSVGAMMALVMGAREPAALARACDLGVAMQLSNIARDVGEDGRAGRLYLPLQWLREEGIDPDTWLRSPVHDAALGRVVRRLVQAADVLYARAGAGIAALPLACRPGINAARLVYAAIGHEVGRRNFDSVSSRAVVPRHRKAALLARAALQLVPDATLLEAPCLDANRFLLDAVAHLDMVRTAPRRARHWWQIGRRLDDRAAWMVDLFDRLAREEQPIAVQAGRR